MTRVRRGFTLLEVMVALTLTALAAGIAGSALSAAHSTSAAVARHRDGAEAELQLRALVSDLLRHAPPVDARDEARLTIVAAGGSPALHFLSRGLGTSRGGSPGTGATWRVTIATVGDTLVVLATPLVRGDVTDAADAADAADAEGGATPLVARLAPARNLRIEVLEPVRPGEAARWRTDWPLRQARPRAVRLTWATDTGDATPLVVALDPLQADGT